MSAFFRALLKTLKAALLVLGLGALGSLLLLITGLQKDLYHWLAAPEWALTGTPDTIVMLGGGGIPSESGLIRSYATAEFARAYTNAVCIIASPEDPGTRTQSDSDRMAQELIMRGVAPDRIRRETEGWNTWQQAEGVADMLGPGARTQTVLLVTNPYHLRRALACFHHAGIPGARGGPTRSVGIDAETGEHHWLRYGIWQAFAIQPVLVRECVALAVYKLQGHL